MVTISFSVLPEARWTVWWSPLVFLCYLKQDGQSVWWSLLVFLCCLKHDGQSIWWSLSVFLWLCPWQELRWSVTCQCDWFCLLCWIQVVGKTSIYITGMPVWNRQHSRREGWVCQVQGCVMVTLMSDGIGVDSDFDVKWNVCWQWLCEMEWVLTVTLM